jgi:hypothetical protein
MKFRTFAVLAVLSALFVVGCTGSNEIINIPLTSDREPGEKATTAEPQIGQGSSEGANSTPELAPPSDQKCREAPADLMEWLMAKDLIGGAVQYQDGQMVDAGGGYFAVAVKVWVEPGSEYDPDRYGRTGDIRNFITNYTTVKGDDAPAKVGRTPWSVDASAKASDCLK